MCLLNQNVSYNPSLHIPKIINSRDIFGGWVEFVGITLLFFNVKLIFDSRGLFLSMYYYPSEMGTKGLFAKQLTMTCYCFTKEGNSITVQQATSTPTRPRHDALCSPVARASFWLKILHGRP